MIRLFRQEFSPPKRMRIAAVFGAGAFALLALDAGLKLQPSSAPAPAPAAPARFAAASATGGVHTLTYYPEQLAALNSLASFTPQANAGVAETRADAAPAVKPPAVAALPAAIDVKPARRAEPAAKAAAAAPVAPPSTDANRAVRVFGFAVPGAAEVAEKVSGFKDGAAHWGESAWAASGRLASFWR
jgi:hypothetical protein